MHLFGVDPGFADAPTGVALLRFDVPSPQLLDTWTLRARARLAGPHRRRARAADRAPGHARPCARAPGAGRCGLRAQLRRPERQAALRLAQLGGGVRGAALTLGLRVVAVQPSESKRALAGSGAADKEQMIAAARTRFGRRLSEHEADAIGHAVAGEVKLRAMSIGRKAA